MYFTCFKGINSFLYQSVNCSKFLEIFREESNWLLPWLHTFTYDTRAMAMQADLELSQQRGDEVHEKLVITYDRLIIKCLYVFTTSFHVEKC